MFYSQGPTTPQSLAASAFVVARAPDKHLQGAAVKFTEKGAIVIRQVSWTKHITFLSEPGFRSLVGVLEVGNLAWFPYTGQHLSMTPAVSSKCQISVLWKIHVQMKTKK